eukprot:m.29617 g.29617  ORF g.29617 m.29617 type:complete len:193 (+) comp12070_c0_seq1:11-589(+)
MPAVVLLTGPSCSGKSTLASAVQELYGSERCQVLAQDAYYREEVELQAEVAAAAEPSQVCWDEPSAINFPSLVHDVQAAQAHCPDLQWIFVEGTMVTCSRELFQIADLVVYVDAPHDVCATRRAARECAVPDPADYFDQVVWPANMLVLQSLRERARNSRVHFIPQSSPEDMLSALQAILHGLERRRSVTDQ